MYTLLQIYYNSSFQKIELILYTQYKTKFFYLNNKSTPHNRLIHQHGSYSS